MLLIAKTVAIFKGMIKFLSVFFSEWIDSKTEERSFQLQIS